MRIIAGEYGGRKLISPGGKVRPMRDMVREALFNIIPCEGRFMDMFAGSGAVGLEALSRGFDFVHFVEISGKNVSLIKQNLDLLRVPEDEYRMQRGNAFFIFKDIEPTPEFDVIFCGTPYITDVYPKVFKLGLEQLLKPDGILIIQTDAEYDPPSGWEKRVFGKDALHFLNATT